SPKPDLGVVDVSFISLTRVLEPMLQHLEEACEIVALIKPQFEVGRDAVGKGGIVRNEEARERAVESVLGFASNLGLSLLGRRVSPLQGADGNVEHLAAFRREGATGREKAP